MLRHAMLRHAMLRHAMLRHDTMARGTGFSGGHGTAAALGQAFADVGYPEGKDVALGTATIGLLSSVTVGILLV
jgi:Na+/glutamate symporter